MTVKELKLKKHQDIFVSKYNIYFLYIIYMEDSYDKITKYLRKHNKTLDDTFKMVILDLLTETNFDYYMFKKILKGAYIIIKDDGYFYKKWVIYHRNNLKKNNKKLEPIMSSSHHSCLNQYRLGRGIIYDLNDDMTNVFDLLIGTSCLYTKSCNKNSDTWFQLERSRLSTITNTIAHIFDFITYSTTGRNIGPFGESEHTENNNPIILQIKGV